MATYAVATSWCEASIAEILARARSDMPGIETSFHVLPLSRVTCTKALLVPTQIVPGATLDADIASIASRGGGGG
jgi:hypothetical protein